MMFLFVFQSLNACNNPNCRAKFGALESELEKCKVKVDYLEKLVEEQEKLIRELEGDIANSKAQVLYFTYRIIDIIHQGAH